MNQKQKKFTVLSGIFSALSLISAIITLLSLSRINFDSNATDTAVEGPFVLAAILIAGFAMLIAVALLVFVGSFFVCGFAIISLKCSDIAIKKETGDKKFRLPRIFRIVSCVEITVSALAVITVIGTFICAILS